MRNPLLIPAFVALCLAPLAAQGDPSLESWRRNLDGTTGQSPSANIDSIVRNILADVEISPYTSTKVYVKAAGVPSHAVGPWANNPNSISDQGWTFRIPRTPAPSANNRPTGLGPIGVMVNGVPFFNSKDARSYNNRGIWNQNAMYFEGFSFDTGKGHTAPRGDYHYHQIPDSLAAQKGENFVDHSPVLGFAFDGYPIYGPYAFANPDASGGIVRMATSYQTRNMTQRRTLPDGTQLNQRDWGPDVSAQYPLGCYIEDFEFLSGLGHLDEHNGRFLMTPEYTAGTYAYFATLDAAGVPVYPYLVGPEYYGVVDTANLGPGGGKVTIPGTATSFTPFEIFANDVIGGATATIAVGGAEPSATIMLAWSLKGGGPISTQYGLVALSPPISSDGPFTADAAGLVALTASIPSKLMGRTFWSQALQIDSAGVASLSLPYRVRVR